MSEQTSVRSSHDAVLPDDVTDPLLWRAAYDVAAAHRPDERGRCPSLLCAGQGSPCEPLRTASRAMRLASGGAAVSRRSVARETPAPAQRRRRAA
ncbi:hypothetical protein MRQ36_25260 [Micromonospora sp. R77]|uniref:hypothetical protein n=1 Tax=Micromonospora sp. R77 TaxID=2925836 RepID=UPI001F60FEB2|nr:hypothetical protein [Micromonospora sp. R77]MCI4065685.1 hypothetical protein [Micromonospora sp. R77]